LPSEFAIETRDLVKVYNTGGVRFEALRGISLKIRRGELVSIVGPSGSGKSTLLHLVGLLDRPTSGQVFIGGKDVSKLSEEERSTLRNQEIGFVFQAYNLVHRLTSIENVELPLIARGTEPAVRRDVAMKMLDAVGLAAKFRNRPAELSGGEQQRVAIARALAASPAIVLGDEPTGNVDTKTAKQIMKVIREVNEKTGTTCALITHNPEIAAETRHHIAIRDGMIEREEVDGQVIE
jgi:putative ABC transport system ATP-binding protein